MQTLPSNGVVQMNTNYVFVLDTNKQQLKPCPPDRARHLLSQGKAAVFRRYPFTLILHKEVESPPIPYLELRIDPGSKFTGFALVDTGSNAVIWAMELEHRGGEISSALQKRAAQRRRRRTANIRHRKARFDRHKPEGWLAPSLIHRVQTVETWVKRIMKFTPVASIAVEQVKFDLQKLENPSIEGIEYQQGTLAGYTLLSALLEHWGRECVYCGAKDVRLQIEHIHPKSKGGTNRFNNLALACTVCNQRKGNQLIEEFLSDDLSRLKRVKSHQKKSLSDAAAVNATRNKIVEVLAPLTNLLNIGNGAWTKMVRVQANYDKQHWIDASCVATDIAPALRTNQPLEVKANGHGNRQNVRMNKYGFPCSKPKQPFKDWKAGDIVKVLFSKGKRKGVEMIGRIKTASAKCCEITVKGERISFKPLDAKPIHRSDGYRYSFCSV